MRALFFIFCPCFSLLTAQIPTAVDSGGGPRLSADTGTETLSIRLEALEIDVAVRGYLAETTYTMSFFNDQTRSLEGADSPGAH